jgi:predicted outer membrane repeat protein
MDQSSFDRIAKLLGGATTRRRGLTAVLGAAIGLPLVADADAKRGTSAAREAGRNRDTGKGKGKGKPGAEGPCGDGSRKDNACTKDRQCCTGYCRKGLRNKDGQGRCRCIRKGKACKPSQTCCKGACENGVCGGGGRTPVPTGQACDPALDTCADVAASCVAYDSATPTGTYCLLPGGAACAADAECVTDFCPQGECRTPVPTGESCDTATDACVDSAASCIAYDSDDPAGTFCVLPTGATCSANGECYSQECASGTCAAVTCDVCSNGCPYANLDDAIAGTADGGRIRIDAGTWAGPSTADISKSLRFEACGGVTGVIIQPVDWLGIQAVETATVTLKNLEFTNLVVGAFGSNGASPSSIATLIVRGCTVDGTDQYSLYQSANSHAIVEDSSFTGASVYFSSDANPSETATLTLVRTLVTAPGDSKNTLELYGPGTVTLTDSTFSAGEGDDGAGLYIANTDGSGLTLSVTLDGTTAVTGNTASGRGGGIYLVGGAGNTIALDLKDTTTVTGNTALTTNAGSGLAALVPAGATVTVTGGGTRITGNANDPQCAKSTDSSTWTAVPDCATF